MKAPASSSSIPASASASASASLTSAVPMSTAAVASNSRMNAEPDVVVIEDEFDFSVLDGIDDETPGITFDLSSCIAHLELKFTKQEHYDIMKYYYKAMVAGATDPSEYVSYLMTKRFYKLRDGDNSYHTPSFVKATFEETLKSTRREFDVAFALKYKDLVARKIHNEYLAASDKNQTVAAKDYNEHLDCNTAGHRDILEFYQRIAKKVQVPNFYSKIEHVAYLILKWRTASYSQMYSFDDEDTAWMVVRKLLCNHELTDNERIFLVNNYDWLVADSCSIGVPDQAMLKIMLDDSKRDKHKHTTKRRLLLKMFQEESAAFDDLADQVLNYWENQKPFPGFKKPFPKLNGPSRFPAAERITPCIFRNRKPYVEALTDGLDMAAAMKAINVNFDTSMPSRPAPKPLPKRKAPAFVLPATTPNAVTPGAPSSGPSSSSSFTYPRSMSPETNRLKKQRQMRSASNAVNKPKDAPQAPAPKSKQKDQTSGSASRKVSQTAATVAAAAATAAATAAAAATAKTASTVSPLPSRSRSAKATAAAPVPKPPPKQTRRRQAPPPASPHPVQPATPIVDEVTVSDDASKDSDDNLSHTSLSRPGSVAVPSVTSSAPDSSRASVEATRPRALDPTEMFFRQRNLISTSSQSVIALTSHLSKSKDSEPVIIEKEGTSEVQYPENVVKRNLGTLTVDPCVLNPESVAYYFDNEVPCLETTKKLMERCLGPLDRHVRADATPILFVVDERISHADLLDTLSDNPHYQDFSKLVAADTEQIVTEPPQREDPKFGQVAKKPMDLHTIAELIKSGEANSAEELDLLSSLAASNHEVVYFDGRGFQFLENLHSDKTSDNDGN